MGMRKSDLTRRAAVTHLLAGTAIFSTGALAQPGWPNKQVRMVLPFPGGASDVLTRVLLERLQTRLGQPFFADARSGAGGNIGMEAARNAPPDGYTAVSATIGTLSINQYLYAKLPYEPDDFICLSRFWEAANALLVPAQHPASTVAEFLAWARKQPKGITFGSAGIGTSPHLSGELFRMKTGINALHIPFRGAAQSMPALVSGEVDCAIESVSSFTPLIKSGRIKALAVASAERWPTLPEVPTMAESGVQDFVSVGWGAIAVPRLTPADTVARFSEAIRAACAEPALQQKFLEIGARALVTTVEQTHAFNETERAKWREVIRVAGIKPQ